MRCAAQTYVTPAGNTGRCHAEGRVGVLLGDGLALLLCNVCYRISELKPIRVYARSGLWTFRADEQLEESA